MSDATGGSYTLVVALADDATLSAGALGAGGFSRVDRHRRTARGDHDVRHWHVDYLLGHPDARIDRVVRSVGVDVECAVAERLPAGPIDGFGASDCGCSSHLASGDRFGRGGEADDALDALAERSQAAHETAVAASADPDATVEVVAGDADASDAE